MTFVNFFNLNFCGPNLRRYWPRLLLYNEPDYSNSGGCLQVSIVILALFGIVLIISNVYIFTTQNNAHPPHRSSVDCFYSDLSFYSDDLDDFFDV